MYDKGGNKCHFIDRSRRATFNCTRQWQAGTGLNLIIRSNSIYPHKEETIVKRLVESKKTGNDQELIQSYLIFYIKNQSAEGAGGLDITRDNKVGESE